MNKADITLDQVIDLHQAAKRLKTSGQYIRNLLVAGQLKTVNVGKVRLILTSSVDEFQQTHQPMPDGHCTPNQAAEHIGVTTQTILNWIRTGYLPAKQLQAGERNRWAIDMNDLSGKRKHKPFQKREEQQEPEQVQQEPEQLTLFDADTTDTIKVEFIER